MLVAPHMHVEQPLVDGALVGLAEAAQVAFVEVGQCANRLEGFFGRDVEVVGDLVAQDDGDLASLLDLHADGPSKGAGKIEIGRE